MPLQLDGYDVSILKSLLINGRKSFREISRETGITTPTVKARFTRLVTIGFIKSVSPILNFDIIENENILNLELKGEHKSNDNLKLLENENNKNKNNKPRINQQQDIKSKIKKGLKIKLDCDFCKLRTILLLYWMSIWIQAKIFWENRINKKKVWRKRMSRF
jgi:DNA-binding Lrp family transcriptional regulator